MGIEVWGTVSDHLGNPVPQAKITLMAPGAEITSRTSDSGAYSLRVTAPGAYRMFVGMDQSHSVPLELKLHDLALVEWVGIAPGSLTHPSAHRRQCRRRRPAGSAFSPRPTTTERYSWK